LQPGFGIVGRRQPIVGPRIGFGDAAAEHKGIVCHKRTEETLLLPGVAEIVNQVAPFPALAEGLGDGAVGLCHFSNHQRLRSEVDAMAAVFDGHGGGADAEGGALPDNVPVKRRGRLGNLVARQRQRADFCFGKLAGLHLPLALSVGDQIFHAGVLIFTAQSVTRDVLAFGRDIHCYLAWHPGAAAFHLR
jgi:hypothetical protein